VPDPLERPATSHKRGADAFAAASFNVDDLLVVLHDVERASYPVSSPASPSSPSNGSSSCVGTATVNTSPSA